MIKALAGNKVLIGLSDGNLKRLQMDNPIKFNLKELGLIDLDVVIFHGKTEADMTKMFMDAGLIDPHKTIIEQPGKDKI